MRIALYSEDFPPYAGGIAQWAAGISQSLADRGHRVAIHTRRRDNMRYEAPEGCDLHTIEGRRWRQWRSWIVRRYAKQQLAMDRPDVMLSTHWNFGRGLLPVVRRAGIPLVVVMHGLEVTRVTNRLKKAWLHRTLAHSHKVLAVSHYTRRRVLEHFPDLEHHIAVLPNGVDTRRFQPDTRQGQRFRDTWNIPTNVPVLATIARVIPRKGHDLVIRALPQVLKRHPDLVYLIAGESDAHYAHHLRELGDSLGIGEHLIFTGSLQPDELPAAHNAADIYIMTSRILDEGRDVEGFGITYLEAGACGKPVIGADSGGVADAVEDGVNGLLLPEGSIPDIVRAVETLLDDRALANRLGEQGLHRMQAAFTWDRIAGQVEEHLS